MSSCLLGDPGFLVRPQRAVEYCSGPRFVITWRRVSRCIFLLFLFFVPFLRCRRLYQLDSGFHAHREGFTSAPAQSPHLQHCPKLVAGKPCPLFFVVLVRLLWIFHFIFSSINQYRFMLVEWTFNFLSDLWALVFLFRFVAIFTCQTKTAFWIFIHDKLDYLIVRLSIFGLWGYTTWNTPSFCSRFNRCGCSLHGVLFVNNMRTMIRTSRFSGHNRQKLDLHWGASQSSCLKKTQYTKNQSE